MKKTMSKIRVSGSGDEWRLHECLYQGEHLVLVRDWNTLFASREEAAAEGRAYVAHMIATAAPEPGVSTGWVFDGDMPADIGYDPYSGIPL